MRLLNSHMVAIFLICFTHSAAAGEARLIVADTQAEHLLVYSVPEMTLLADFPGIKLGSHAGTISLSHNQLLFMDEKREEMDVLDVNSDVPRIAVRMSAPLVHGARFGWIAVDTSQRFVAATSDNDEDVIETLTLADIRRQLSRQVNVDTTKQEPELGVLVGGSPAQVILNRSINLEAYPFDQLLKGVVTQLPASTFPPESSLSVGVGHGGSFSSVSQTLSVSTTKGMVICALTAAGLSLQKTVSWDVAGKAGGQNYRQRMTADQQTVFGPTVSVVIPADWATASVDILWIDIRTATEKRTPLSKGLISRGGVSSTLAAYATIEPEGDFLKLINVESQSPGFRSIVGNIPLQSLTKRPRSGSTPVAGEGRYAAITPDGKWAFATLGGDGLISVINTTTKALEKTIRTPTSLIGGGYIVAISEDQALFEYAGR
ncbi:hypothetical protein LAV84_27415 [Rhizobium sp. VS19-DR104.2]|uniref:hypothetical protein n=1 Tax=unclassified Rhizobium TaxID=2613769 RepID=UPI001CC7539D|nr:MULTISPECIES: hypothetical protein [unclassified Rhizobium]MBZ5763265.1 hypothetical protein [Rhizobium sp. VS19-DR96]MBZ5769370.1 hypothetical protein [Rhizobium sp. VS19-DR129.2]MBZ5776924.1 hypothetical protein [Rhizobium sp. VS19-DRK62.2]MBZ5787864.1 hypothetical protein [Rhizobium sp. VS19-DR121]MBZ5805323.1 hypothetical protein [Rhizobium sp. VS19-DR181]